MSVPWPIGPDRRPERPRRPSDAERLAAVNARLAAAEAQMAALEQGPSLAHAFLRGFAIGALLLVLALLALVAA